MKLIQSDSQDVRYNLALEEYLFHNHEEDDFVIFSTNDASLVVGKHQNAYEEVNVGEVERRAIPVVRRISGGGTVYHDLGNLNYTFIAPCHPDRFAGYDAFLTPVIQALREIGVPAKKRGSGDIVLDDRKISGSAQSIRRNRVLHHGTLLFDADLSALKGLLKPEQREYCSKAVKSVRSEVTNISEHLGDKAMKLRDFQRILIEHLFPDGIEEFRINALEEERIRTLAGSKYEQWEWNFGTSPAFVFRTQRMFDGRQVEVELSVERGLLKEAGFRCEGQLEAQVSEKLAALAGKRYSYSGFLDHLQDADLTDCFF